MGLFKWIGKTVKQVSGADYQQELNKNMADYSFDQNKEMWDLKNQYNSPTAQMERLQEAGLNPNLVYGQGGAGATGQANDIPKHQASASTTATHIPQLLGTLGQFYDVKYKASKAYQEQTISDWMKTDAGKQAFTEGLTGKATSQTYKGQSDYLDWYFKNKYGEKQIQASLSRSQGDASSAWTQAKMKQLEEELYNRSGTLFKDKTRSRKGWDILNRYKGNPPKFMEPIGGWDSWR